MRLALYLALALAIGGLAPVASEAKPTRKAPPKAVPTSSEPNAYDYDPAGNYRGYPDWARRALSGRQGGGAGR